MTPLKNNDKERLRELAEKAVAAPNKDTRDGFIRMMLTLVRGRKTHDNAIQPFLSNAEDKALGFNPSHDEDNIPF